MSENDYSVTLVFKKTRLTNKWVYDGLAIYKIDTYLRNMKVIQGKYQYSTKGWGSNVSELEIADTGIVKKLKQKDQDVIKLKGKGDSEADLVFVKFNSEVSDELYSEIGKKVDISKMNIHDLVYYSHKIGKVIESLELKKGLAASYFVLNKRNESIDDIVLTQADKRFIIDSAYDKPKVEKMEATYSSSANYSNKSILTNNSINSENDKIFKAQVQKQKKIDVSEDGTIVPKEKTEIELDSDKIVKIKEEIKRKVICQDDAVDKVVNAIYLNQRRIINGERRIPRILLDGPTGTGKTFIVEEAGERMGIPFVRTNATNYSTTGYKGSDLIDILITLLRNSNGDIDLAQRGIIVLDEFDKLGTNNGDKEIAMRNGIQDELLTFIEGAKYSIEYEGEKYEFDTSKITFIVLGAFTNLRERKIAENEKKHKQALGFGTIENNEYDRTYTITMNDYISEGLGRELVGRISCLAYTNELGLEDLEKILRESEDSALKTLICGGSLVDATKPTKIIVDEEMISSIVKMAFDLNTGARALNDICEALMDIISNDLIAGVKEIKITKKHLDKIDKMNQRKYFERKH